MVGRIHDTEKPPLKEGAILSIFIAAETLMIGTGIEEPTIIQARNQNATCQEYCNRTNTPHRHR